MTVVLQHYPIPEYPPNNKTYPVCLFLLRGEVRFGRRGSLYNAFWSIHARERTVKRRKKKEEEVRGGQRKRRGREQKEKRKRRGREGN